MLNDCVAHCSENDPFQVDALGLTGNMWLKVIAGAHGEEEGTDGNVGGYRRGLVEQE
jgi:hypothetical protein